MNLLMALMIFCGVDVFFLKDSPDLLVRVIPQHEVERLTLYYSYSGSMWGSRVIEKGGQFFDAVIKTPLDARMVGIYAVYEDATIDDNGGQLYLYELSIYPRMLMPFSSTDLELVIAQARKKITTNTHVDEAIALLEYAGSILNVLPVIAETQGETRRNLLQGEVNELKAQVGR
jgi:hypothetical protein